MLRAGEETADALEDHRGGAEDAQHVCGRGLGACDAGDDDVSAGTTSINCVHVNRDCDLLVKQATAVTVARVRTYLPTGSCAMCVTLPPA